MDVVMRYCFGMSVAYSLCLLENAGVNYLPDA